MSWNLQLGRQGDRHISPLDHLGRIFIFKLAICAFVLLAQLIPDRSLGLHLLQTSYLSFLYPLYQKSLELAFSFLFLGIRTMTSVTSTHGADQPAHNGTDTKMSTSVPSPVTRTNPAGLISCRFALPKSSNPGRSYIRT
ncbi:hypothetical protein O181_048000 [Austropuccinia psidii MF-1]|uniref:Uncharacterized protein n=1 Tax=Austropuccinia psidii MF-1 TaxID=1389203 RepID=A0A9Q3HNR9_9BASI|nr:hypothetical protein [Austropuccinia psidii MF-1]